MKDEKIPKLALSYEEAAEATGLSDDTLQRLVSEGRLKVVKVGRRTLIRPSTLEKFLEEQEALRNT